MVAQQLTMLTFSVTGEVCCDDQLWGRCELGGAAGTGPPEQGAAVRH